jgi:hypothetical protein
MSMPLAQFIVAKAPAEMSSPVGAVENVEKTVFRRLHDHLAGTAFDREIGENHVLGGGVVPGVAWRGLVVPHVFAALRLERHDRRDEQVVAAAGTSDRAIPRRAVAGADVEQVEIRIVGHRIPDGPAAAELPPFAFPGLGRHLERRVLERLRRIARHRVEAPDLLARFRVVRRLRSRVRPSRRRRCR